MTIRVAVILHTNIPDKPATIKAFTAAVNDHGALLICPEAFPSGVRVVLENVGTRKRVDCRVTRRSQALVDGFEVPVEFDQPLPGFWNIAFPPQDWKPGEG